MSSSAESMNHGKTPQRRSRRDEAYERILSGILNGEFLPRERLVPSRLAGQFKTSRTPVREALQQLEVQGYVAADNGRAMLVKDHSAEEVQEFYELREALECGAIELVCERISDERLQEARRCHEEMTEAAREGDFDRVLELNATFHMELLYGAANNERLRSMIRSLRNRFLEKRLIKVSMIEDWGEKMGQHERLLEALEKRDRSLAREVVRDHLATALEVQKRWAH